MSRLPQLASHHMPYHAILCHIMQYPATPCNTPPYHASNVLSRLFSPLFPIIFRSLSVYFLNKSSIILTLSIHSNLYPLLFFLLIFFFFLLIFFLFFSFFFLFFSFFFLFFSFFFLFYSFFFLQLYTFFLFLAFSYFQNSPGLFAAFGFYSGTPTMPVFVGLVLFSQTIWSPVDKASNK